MSEFKLIKKLSAFQQGRPVELTEKLSTIKSPDNSVFSLAFVRMGGESIPWGIALKIPGKEPEYFICPDPRKRTELSKTITEFGERILFHFNKIIHKDSPQIWLANPSHLDMLHFIALRYLWTKFELPGEEIPGTHAQKLKAIGRLANILFYTSQIPGQTLIHVATESLKSDFAFPTDDYRSSHLGYLMAWLTAKGDYTARSNAAREAEFLSVSTSLDPQIEKNILEKPVEAYNNGDTSFLKNIQSCIKSELKNRIELIENARSVISKDSRESNPGLNPLETDTKNFIQKKYIDIETAISRGESPFLIGPTTDSSPTLAAARYLENDEAAVKSESQMLLHDSQLQSEAAAAGNAIQSKVVNVARTIVGRTNYVSWIVESKGDLPLRLREGDSVSLVSLPKSEFRIKTITLDVKKQMRIIELDVISPKTAKGGVDLASKKYIGKNETFLPRPFVGLIFRKMKSIFNKNAPGAWLVDQLKDVLKESTRRGA
jgi:hypothetical protein